MREVMLYLSKVLQYFFVTLARAISLLSSVTRRLSSVSEKLRIFIDVRLWQELVRNASWNFTGSAFLSVVCTTKVKVTLSFLVEERTSMTLCDSSRSMGSRLR